MSQLNSLDDQIQTRRAELKKLVEDIAERGKYKREQEAIITEMIEQGNSELMSLVHDIAVAKKELRDIKTELRMSKVDLSVVRRQIQVQATTIVIAST